MRYCITGVVSVFICFCTYAQHGDTIAPSSNESQILNNQLEKKIRYENDKTGQEEYGSSISNDTLMMIISDEAEMIQMDDVESSGYKSVSLIKDGAENAPLGKVYLDDEFEIHTKKRIADGPSQFDSRIEVRDLNPLIQQHQPVIINQQSVGVVIEKNMMHQVTDSLYQLDISSTLGSLYNLCPGEAFEKQPVVGVGTAFIIDEQFMMTAAHVFNRSIDNYVVVFGFEIINKVGTYEAYISATDIYYPTKIMNTSDDLDVTLFQIDRSLNKPVLKRANSTKVPNNTSVYMIGHPMGLPKKVAFNASIKNNEHPQYFFTSLDAFQGNSGSPVFRLDTDEVIGILVSGELDYKWNGNCNASTLCRIPYCKGEKVIRIEEVMNELNQ
jgi:S1-C subfamily serine protease